MVGCAVLKRTIFSVTPLLVMVAAVGCSSYIATGKAQLPAGIEAAVVPDVEQVAYLYANSEPPLALPTQLFQPGEDGGDPPESMPKNLELQSVTVVVGTTPGEFASTLEFGSERDAEVAWSLFEKKIESEEVWGKLASPQMRLVRGTSPWADLARGKLDSSQLVPLRDRDGRAWALITNLPQDPPSPPLAVGVVSLRVGFIDSLEKMAGIPLDGIENAFRIVRVNSVAFGLYADTPVEVSETIDREFLKQSGARVLLVSHSSYPGVLVSFMLSIAAGRTGMEIIDLGDTNARYRTIEDLHLIVKNRGSFVYGALATTRADAEGLILSALSN